MTDEHTTAARAAIRPIRRVRAGVYESRDGHWRFVLGHAVGATEPHIAGGWHTWDLTDEVDGAAWGDIEPTLIDAVEAVVADVAFRARRETSG